MRLSLQFVISFGILLALFCLIAAWLFRSANAPYMSKFILPVGILSLAFYTPFTVANLMGYPVVRTAAQMPPVVELVSMVVTDDTETQVDLWIIVDGGEPRAYRTELTPALKKVLKAAQAELSMGHHAVLRKLGVKNSNASHRLPGDADFGDNNPSTNNDGAADKDKKGNNNSSDPNGIGNDDMDYGIDENFVTRLPRKSLQDE